jgi:WD40-like Beta Propeller Repeat
VAFISERTGAADVHVFDLRSGRITGLTADAAIESSPAYSADGRSVVFVSDRAGVDRLWQVPAGGGQAVPLVVPRLSADPASRPLPSVLELLPDLDQQPPSDLDVRPARRGFRLWFTSAADNVGVGPLIVNGRRSGTGTTMRANQRVRRTDGSLRTNPAIGKWRYNPSPDHSHWHLLHYQRYDLRSLDSDRVAERPSAAAERSRPQNVS